MDWSIFLTSALVCGVVLSVVLTAIMIISAVIAPDMWVGDYPPAIKERFGPMSVRASRLRPYVAAVFFLAVLAIPLIGLVSLQSTLGPISFLLALAFSFLVLLVFNVFDLLGFPMLYEIYAEERDALEKFRNNVTHPPYQKPDTGE